MKQWLPSLVLCLSACVTSNTIVSLGPPAPPPTAKEYVDVLKRWTRHGDLRSDFDATIIVDATFRSPEFRSVQDSLVATEKVTTRPPDCCMVRTSGSRPRFPTRITLLTLPAIAASP